MGKKERQIEAKGKQTAVRTILYHLLFIALDFQQKKE